MLIWYNHESTICSGHQELHYFITLSSKHTHTKYVKETNSHKVLHAGGIRISDRCNNRLLTISDSYKERKHLDKLFY